MAVFAAPFRRVARDTTVLLGVEVAGSDLRPSSGGALDLLFVAADAQAKLRATGTGSVNLADLQPGARERLGQTGVRALYRVDLKPGRYQVRVAARETVDGKVGSVFYDLDVPDLQHDPLALSGIAVASKEGARVPTPIFDEPLKSELRAVLPAPPGALRTFSRDETIVIFAEAYVNRPVRSIVVTTSLISETGRSIFAIKQDRSVENGRCALSATVPMAELAPGGYVLTLTAASPDGASVERSLRFEVADR
jgi:hypothetical protein